MGAKKSDNDKPRCDLIYPPAILEEGMVLLFGASKYEKHNWIRGLEWGRLGGALLRHTLAWLNGESLDPESGLRHLAHLRATAAFLMAYEDYGIGEDDRIGKALLAVKRTNESVEADKKNEVGAVDDCAVPVTK